MKNNKTAKDTEKLSPYTLKHRKERWVQSAVSMFFGILVILSTIGLLLFSDGYAINIKDKSIEKHGAIAVESTPDRAVVFLDGKKKGLTPITLPSIKPGTHTITIRKTGFADWAEKIQVEKQKAVSVKAVLFKTNGDTQIVTDRDIQVIQFASRSDNLVFAAPTSDHQSGIFFRPFRNNFWEINKKDVLLYKSPTEQPEMLLSPDGTRTLLLSKNPLINKDTIITRPRGQGRVYLVDNHSPEALLELADLYSFNQITKVYWPEASDDKILVETPTQILTYDLDTAQVVVLFSHNLGDRVVYTSTAKDNLIYLNPTDKQLYTVSLDGTNREKSLRLDQDRKTIANEKITQIYIDKEEESLILRSSQNLYFKDLRSSKSSAKPLTKVKLDPKATVLSIAPDGNTLLYKDSDGDLKTRIFRNTTISNAKEGTEFTLLDATLIEKDQRFSWHPNSLNIFTIPIRNDGTSAIKILTIDGENYETVRKTPISGANFAISRDGQTLLFEEIVDKTKVLTEISLKNGDIINLRWSE